MRTATFLALFAAATTGAWVAWRATSSGLPSVPPYRHGTSSSAASFEAQKAFYRERLRKNPSGYLDLVQLAGLLLDEARATGETRLYDEAESLARRSLDNFSSDNPGARLVLAEVAEARHDFLGAIRLAREALEKDPTSQFALSTLATSHLALGDVVRASEYADRLLDLRPTIGAYTIHALVSLARGNEAEAIYDLERGIAVEDVGEAGASSKARALLGRHYLSRGEHRLAEAYLRAALAIQPHHSLALGLMGDLEAARGDSSRALSFYTEAFQRSGATVYLLERCNLLRSLGRTEEANRLWDQAERVIRKRMTDGRYGHPHELVRLMLDRGRPEDVSSAVRIAAREAASRRDPSTLLLLARAYAAAGRHGDAREAVRQALRTGWKDAGAYYQAGLAHYAAGDPGRAGFYLSRALELNPRHAGAAEALRRAHRGMKSQPVARSTAQSKATAAESQEPPRRMMRPYQY